MTRTGNAPGGLPDAWTWRWGPDAAPGADRRGRASGAQVLHRIDELAGPVLALTLLAAVERSGAGLTEPLARWAVTPAGVLAGMADPAGERRGRDLLARLAACRPADAVRDLVTGPLGVDGGVTVGDGRCPAAANAAALGPVLRAWLRLSVGEVEPDLPHPSPSLVRAAWASASRLTRDGTGRPRWLGPGVVRNVGGVLTPMASPLAFGHLASRGGSAIALCDPCAPAVVVVVRPAGSATAAELRAEAGALLVGGAVHPNPRPVGGPSA
jgi:hypothetical protein